jgi:putative acetyltransferase
MFTIREACPDDVSALVELWLRSVRATHMFLTEDYVQFFLPLVRESLGSDQLELWVLATDAETLIGFMGGLRVVGRSELDSTGQPFPLLHMRQLT